MEDTRKHLLENYGTAPTQTLCGLPVPGFYQTLALMRKSVDYGPKFAHVGDHTCPRCDAVMKAREFVKQLVPSA